MAVADQLRSDVPDFGPGDTVAVHAKVVEGDKDTVFLPDGRYAQMRNVWFLPSVEALMHWMKRCGLKNVHMIDCSSTTTEEQRATDWMRFHSLSDFLDPSDHRKSIEGHPAPKRAIVTARVPG